MILQKKRYTFLKKALSSFLVLQIVFSSVGLGIFKSNIALASTTNLITNGDFENGLTGYEYTEVAGFTVETVTDTIHGGTNALHLDTTGAGGSGISKFVFSKEVAVEAGKTYEWKFWAKTYSAVGKNTMVGVSTTDGSYLLPSAVTSPNGRIPSGNVAYDSERDAATVGNWHPCLGGEDDWAEYTVTFTTGERTAVDLKFTLWAADRNFYLDDMTLTKVEEEITEFSNGNFENGLSGYKNTTSIGFTAEIVTDTVHGGTNALHLKTDDAAVVGINKNILWQTVAVEANTKYILKFWAKAGTNSNSLLAVRNEDGTMLLPSTFSTDGGAIAEDRAIQESLRSVDDPNNWHQGIRNTSDWEEYTISFTTGDETAVSLTFNLYAKGRELWIDDMTLEAVITEIGQEFANTGFENGLTGYTYTKNANFTVETVTDEKYEGEKALHLSVTDYVTDYAALFYQSIKVEAGKTYQWKFWAKSNSGASQNTMVGVRTADGLNLLPSSISCDTCPNSLASDRLSFDSLRPSKPYMTYAANWHQGIKLTNDWQEYTVTFETLTETTVLLTFNPFASGRELWIDDMSLEQELINADFENGLTGYTAEYLTTEISTDVVHSGEKALKFTFADNESTYDRAMLYQTVAVKANTDYKWSFWYNSISGNVSLVGVRTADGTKLLPSRFITENNGFLLPDHSGFETVRSLVTANWHQGLGNTTANYQGSWKKYTVIFNTGDQTTVSLTINHRATGRSGYIDDWSLEKYTEPQEVVNSGFEDGVTGYQTIGDITVAEETDTLNVFDGQKSLKIESTGGKNDVMLYQEIAVEPNSVYEWNFWFKSTTTTNKLIGVRTANGYQLLPSEISSPNMSALSPSLLSFTETRPVLWPDKWHQGANNEYWTYYTVTFKTNDETVVIPTINLYASGRLGYIDDWSICKIDADGTVLNGDFEAKITDGINDPVPRYEFSDTSVINVKADPTDSTNNALYVKGVDAKVSQTVAVTPYTEYVWSFDLKNDGNLLNGVYVSAGDTKTKLLPSVFKSNDGYVDSSNAVLIGVRDYGKMHYGAKDSEWKQYTVRFYSSGCDHVTLNMNFGAAGYTDNWLLTKNSGDWGDANLDGSINALDLTYMRQGLLGQDTDYSLAGLDINIDGTINLKDLVNMKKKAAADTSHGEYKLVWYDDFGGASLNEDKWSLRAHMRAQDDLVLLSDERAVNVENGTVNLSAGKLNDSKFYANTSLTTSETMIFKYGYVEMRAKIPVGKAAFPGFWMKSSKEAQYRNNPDIGSEIDIFEVFATTPGTLASNCHKWYDDDTGGHYDLSNPYSSLLSKINKSTYTFQSVEAATDWHTFGLLWTPEKLVFSVDGIEYMTVNISITDESSTVDKWYYDYGKRGDGLELHHDYHYLIMNNYLMTENGMTIGPTADENTEFPFNYTIDYVRLYQKPNEGDLVILE